MVATGALSSQKSVRQNPAAKIRFELLVHEVWQWIPQVVFDLLLEQQPVALDQLVEGCLFWFVALVVIGFGIGNRHRLDACLQLPWLHRIALLTPAMVPWSGITIRLRDPVRCDHIGGPFGRWLIPAQEGSLNVIDQCLLFIGF